jgi:hypothetical protein
MKTEVIFCIDGSGSMGSKATDVRGGFNTYVDELKKDKDGQYSLSAVVFNTSVFPLFTQKELKEVPELTDKNYVPGGGTALYDAIGAALDEVKDSTANYCVHCGKKRGSSHKFCATCGNELTNGKSKYLLIVMTDGEENSSLKYRKHHIVQKIKDKEGQGNWTVVYLGANQDAMAEGTAMGASAGNTLTYRVADTKTYYSALATSTANFAGGQSLNSTSFGMDVDGAYLGIKNTPTDTTSATTPATYPVAVTSHRLWKKGEKK